MTPIYQTSTYVQESPGVTLGYDYSRGSNPTRTALQGCLASLENARFAIAFSSGMAATDAIVRQVPAGGKILCTNDLYGGTYRLLSKVYNRHGVEFETLDLSDASSLSARMTPDVRMVWIETPTNPLLNIIDIAGIRQAMGSSDAILVVDNTFASPFLQNPLDLGADVVVHSATKYLGGHSDVVMGACMMNREDLYDSIGFVMRSAGGVPGPFDSFLVLRGLKTLHLRMERHCYNGRKVAEYLRGHSAVAKVRWPGFEDHPNHDVARAQMRDFGGMVSMELKDDSTERAIAVLKKTRVFALAESLGGVESLIGHPATMTHASIPREERIKAGLTDSLIRLSVGVEDSDDLIADLKAALG